MGPWVHFKKEPAEDKEETHKIDRERAKRLKSKAVQNLRKQHIQGIPTNEDEAGLKKLAQQYFTPALLTADR